MTVRPTSSSRAPCSATASPSWRARSSGTTCRCPTPSTRARSRRSRTPDAQGPVDDTGGARAGGRTHLAADRRPRLHGARAVCRPLPAALHQRGRRRTEHGWSGHRARRVRLHSVPLLDRDLRIDACLRVHPHRPDHARAAGPHRRRRRRIRVWDGRPHALRARRPRIDAHPARDHGDRAGRPPAGARRRAADVGSPGPDLLPPGEGRQDGGRWPRRPLRARPGGDDRHRLRHPLRHHGRDQQRSRRRRADAGAARHRLQRDGRVELQPGPHRGPARGAQPLSGRGHGRVALRQRCAGVARRRGDRRSRAALQDGPLRRAHHAVRGDRQPGLPAGPARHLAPRARRDGDPAPGPGLSRSRLSAVIACYRDAPAIRIMHDRLVSVFTKLGVDYEIIFVNDASPDNAAEVLADLAKTSAQVTVINHTRNFGSQGAFTSGMRVATGDAVVLMDGDLQDPPELIESFFEKWRQGYDVVYGARVKRDATLFLQVAYKVFYRLFRAASYLPMPLDAGDFSLLDRRVVDALNSLPETNRFLRGLRTWVGFRQVGVPYRRPERMFGRTTNSLLKNLAWARQAIFSFSYIPLELITFLALVTVVIALLAAVVQIVLRLIRPDLVPSGFTTIIILILFLGGIQLLCLGIIGSYLAHIYDEVKRRPPYLVKSILNPPRPRPRDG